MVVWERKWRSGTHAPVLSLVMVQWLLSSCLLAYHLQHEETDWFDKPRQGRGGPETGPDRRQVNCTHRMTVMFPSRIHF